MTLGTGEASKPTSGLLGNMYSLRVKRVVLFNCCVCVSGTQCGLAQHVNLDQLVPFE